MKITLETVRNTLRDGLGRDCFVASFIKSIEETQDCSTACITIDGMLKYSPEFVTESIRSESDLFCLLFHEVLHPMFGHFIYQGGKLENIAADCVINASISLLFAGPSGEGSLFRKFYKPNGIEGLLRPNSQMGYSRYSKLYGAFYGTDARSSPLTTGEVCQTLKILTPPEEAAGVVLMGGHVGENAAGVGNCGQEQFPVDVVAKFAEDIQESVMRRPGGQMAGRGTGLFDLFISIVKSHMTLKKAMLAGWTTKNKVDGFRQQVQRPRIQVSPIPLRPSKRDLVLLSAGIVLFQYHQMATAIEEKTQGLAVYLDVSGSVNQHLPHILGLLKDFRSELKTAFVFSNAVIEMPFESMLKGMVRTTYGTDFDCVAKSILEKGFDKALVITDGYAELNAELRAELMKKRVRVLTVLFGNRDVCPELAALGEVVKLADMAVNVRSSLPLDSQGIN